MLSKQKTAYEIDHCDWSSDVALPISQSCLTLCDPMNRSSQASLSITNSRSSNSRLLIPKNWLSQSLGKGCETLYLPPSTPCRLLCF